LDEFELTIIWTCRYFESKWRW